MNWPILLTKYSRAILEDEVALVLLAAIERQGLSTESDIVANSGINAKRVSSTLFKLHLNGLIQYGEEHIRLTDRGRSLLDRFDLTDVILDDALAAVEGNSERRHALTRLVRAYRQDSPSLFQNSLSTLHAWSKLIGWLTEHGKTSITDEELRGSQRSFLLRDLRNWCAHASVAFELSHGLESSFRMLLFDNRVDADKCRISHDECYNSSIDYLMLIDHSVYTERTIEQVASQCHLHELHRIFHVTQCKSEPFRWYDVWKASERDLPVPARAHSWQRRLRKLASALSNAFLEEQDSNISQHEALHLFKLHWDASEFRPVQGGEFLDHIFNAEDIDTLGRLTNLDRESLVQLLETMSAKCSSLIRTANKAMDSDEE